MINQVIKRLSKWSIEWIGDWVIKWLHEWVSEWVIKATAIVTLKDEDEAEAKK